MGIDRPIDRRRFLAFTAGAPLILSSTTLFGRTAPSNRVNLAVIGCGGRANGIGLYWFTRLDDVRIVAAVDPHESRRNTFARDLNSIYKGKYCKAYNDFRDVLARDDIDGVVVCTPDHWHVPIALAAARAGKDMYVEKPLSPALGWCWKLRKEMEKRSLIFQFGTQQRSGYLFRQACEFARNGYVGEIKSVDVWCPNGTGQMRGLSVPYGSTGSQPVPDGFDWDLWLGPAPKVAYHPDRTAGFSHVSDYSLGFISVWGIHSFDIAQWGLGMDRSGPTVFEGVGTFPPKGRLCNNIENWNVRCTYANGVNVRFMDSKYAIPEIAKYHTVKRGHGTVFHGTDGWVGVDRQGLHSSGNNRLRKQKLKDGDKRLYSSDNHAQNFVDCIRSRKQTICPLKSAIRVDTICHLANLAVRTGRRVQWDPQEERIVNAGEIDIDFGRSMREGYRF